MIPKISLKTIVVVAAVLLVSVASYFAFIPKEETSTVRIAYNKFLDSLPYFIALEKGFFEEEGIKVEGVFQQDASLITQSLLANKADVGLPVTVTDILLIEEKDPGKIKIFIGGAETREGNHQQTAIIVKTDSPYKSLNDLKGKKLATLPGGVGIIFPKMIFKSSGIDPESIDYVQMIPTNWIPSLEAKQVDAVWTVEPLSTVAVTSGTGKSILNYSLANSVHNPFVAVGFAFRTDFAEKNPDIAKKIIKVMERAVKFKEENPSEAKRILAKYSDLPEDLAGQLGNLSVYREAKDFKYDVQVISDLMFQLKFLKSPIDVSRVIYAG
jgi:NitT/TauT family transport system substrate-binding protein